jgi:hypothetical protein
VRGSTRAAINGIGAALERVAFVQNGNEQWWECNSPACKQKIAFVMLANALDRDHPTCFCGSVMKRTYIKPQIAKCKESLFADLSAARIEPPAVQEIVFSLQPMN